MQMLRKVNKLAVHWSQRVWRGLDGLVGWRGSLLHVPEWLDAAAAVPATKILGVT